MSKVWCYFVLVLTVLSITTTATPTTTTPTTPTVTADKRTDAELSTALHNLIDAYRDLGYILANTDPLSYAKLKGARPPQPRLDYSYYNFTSSDLNTSYDIGEPLFGSTSNSMKLQDLITLLNSTYCGNIGFEFGHVVDRAKREWLINRIETMPHTPTLVTWQEILNFLVQSDTFASFVKQAWPTAWTFPMSGLNNQLTAIKSIIRAAASTGIEAIHFGMHHRGRDEFMHNVMNIPLEAVFHYMDADTETPDTPVCSQEGVCYTGDSIYGMGTSAWLDVPNGNKSIWVSVASNSAHLDSNNPIVGGSAGALMDMLKDPKGDRVLPVLISGDGAVSAQGIVEETKLLTNHILGYQTGGFIHLINNNQIAHTVDPAIIRAVPYPTDFAKVVDGPIFHVNGDDPESVAYVVELALAFRKEFHMDVVIDLVGYRREGHYGNDQADHPFWSNPLMYHIIAAHPTELQVYNATLIARGAVTATTVSDLVEAETTRLATAWANRTIYPDSDIGEEFIWPFLEAPWPKARLPSLPVNMSSSVFETLGTTLLFNATSGLTLRSDLASLIATRQTNWLAQKVCWAVAESLAIASLLNEGFDVRLTGQDTSLGIAIVRAYQLSDDNTFQSIRPLDLIRSTVNPSTAGTFRLFDSSLSELAVAGYELGYSIQRANDTLTIWDMHNADFINNAQMILDQYIAEGEVKWFRQTPLTLILPMGYEACNGPEHSNVRMARLLLCTDGSAVYWNKTRDLLGEIMAVNIIVVYPSTPANYYHALRRQMHFNNIAGFALRKPLFMPVGLRLLKREDYTSNFTEFLEGEFLPIIPEPDSRVLQNSQVRRVMFCSGQVILALQQARVNRARWDVAIVRLEQLSPFPFALVEAEVNKYPNADVMWVQEDPRNMGAWFHFEPRFHVIFPGRPLLYAGRNTSAAAATGFCKLSIREEALLLNDAFDLPFAPWNPNSGSNSGNDESLSTGGWVGVIIGVSVVVSILSIILTVYGISKLRNYRREERLLVN